MLTIGVSPNFSSALVRRTGRLSKLMAVSPCEVIDAADKLKWFYRMVGDSVAALDDIFQERVARSVTDRIRSTFISFALPRIRRRSTSAAGKAPRSRGSRLGTQVARHSE